jgi:hypothetical protein
MQSQSKKPKQKQPKSMNDISLQPKKPKTHDSEKQSSKSTQSLLQ